ncbi:hypothetical protein CR513_29356, partial [Mucuna pruriens]
MVTKTNDAKVVVDFLKSNIFYQFGVLKALISDQGSHFCNRAMSSLLHKYGWCIELPQPPTPRQMAKLKYSMGKSRKHCKRWPIPAGRIGADSLRTLYGHTELHTKLCWGFYLMHVETTKNELYQSPYQIVFRKACHLSNIRLTRLSSNATWSTTKPASKENSNSKN